MDLYNNSNIVYNIIVDVEDTVNNKILTFSKMNISKNIDISYTPTLIEKKDILDYIYEDVFNYCKYNIIDMKSIVVNSYEIKHDYDNLDIYFSIDQDATFDTSPSIYVSLNKLSIKPMLNCEQIDVDTIMWSWEWEGNTQFISEIVDFKTDNILSQTPVGINYFIESGLDANTTISRYINVQSADGYSKSDIVSFTLNKIESNDNVRLHQYVQRNQSYETVCTKKASRLKAFQSGVGDFKDCEITKGDAATKTKTFKLSTDVIGVRASKDLKFNTVKFFYRYIAKGKIDYVGYNGSFDISITANSITNIELEPECSYTGDINNISNSKHIHFDDNCFVAEIKMTDLIPQLQRNYRNNRYEFQVSMSNINGNMKVYTRELGCSEIIDVTDGVLNFVLKGTYDTTIRVICMPTQKTKEYHQSYPPNSISPIMGVINGDFMVTDTGKKDLETFMHTFDIPSDVYDIKYFCDIECDKTDPNGAFIEYKFENQVDNEEYTLTNGDKCIFSSSYIYEDKNEYEEFLYQHNTITYNISDNKEHQIHYSIPIRYNKDDYKRIEFKVTSDNNDILITDVTSSEDYNFDKVDFNVKVRSIQQATGLWNPYIHSGYYYLNNEERFLYSSCSINVSQEDTIQYAREDDIFIDMYLFIKKVVGEEEKYNTRLQTKNDLIINSDSFRYINGYVFPKPHSIIDGFEEYYSTYEYYTKPIICNRTPTKILRINWEEKTNAHCDVKAYAITFDDINGVWRDPVRIYKNQNIPGDLIPSKAMMMKFELKCSLMPELIQEENKIECEKHFGENVNKELSYNITYKKDVLTTSAKSTVGMYVTKIYNLGDSIELENTPDLRNAIVRYVGISEGANVFFQHSNNYIKLKETNYNEEWIDIENIENENVRQYIRFKIEIHDGLDISKLNIELDKFSYYNMHIEDYLSGVGNIQIDQEYNPIQNKEVIKHSITYPLVFNNRPNVVVDNIALLINNLGKDLDFSFGDVVDVLFKKVSSYKNDYDIECNINPPIEINDIPLIATSKELILDKKTIENNFFGVVVTPFKNKFSITPLPQQYSPVILYEVNDIEYTPYKRVFFIDDNNDYTLINKEVFISNGFNIIYLQEYDIDTTAVTVRINGVITFDYKIIDNIIEFDDNVEKGSSIEIKYKIRNSFVVNFINNEAIIEVNGSESNYNVEKVKVFYETNEISNLRKLDHISLNPIYNPLYKGFVYISNIIEDPYTIEVIPMDDYIHANGLNQTNILVLVKDKNDNPLDNIYVNTTCAYGQLDENVKITDINGIACYKYTSCTSNVIDEIKSTVTNNLTGSATIINRKVHN